MGAYKISQAPGPDISLRRPRIQTPHLCAAVSQKARLSVYRQIFILTLTCGHKPWRERVRLHNQLPLWVTGLPLRHRVSSSAVCRGFGIELLL